MSKRLDPLTWQKALIILKDNSIVRIVVEYSGSGDSGEIDEISYYNKEDEEFDESDIEMEPYSLHDLIDPLLQNIEDWYNNEGGFGIVEIDLITLSYTIVNNVNRTEIDTYNHEGSLKNIINNNT